MSLPPLPAQSADTPWPTADWPVGEPRALDRTRFDALMHQAFAHEVTETLGATHAFVTIQGGRLVHERYGVKFGPHVTQPSWSMAKSMTQALIGMLVADGRLDIHAPANVPEWRTPGDERAAITPDQLLRMSSGLEFVEDYDNTHPSDVIEMLFGSGKDDVAHFAAACLLQHPPGTHWSYASGTTNILSRLAAQAESENFPRYMLERLFMPLGMASAMPKFDPMGTFIGSSYCFCTPRDFARFGLLYLRDGVWDGQRVLPEGWVDYARTPTAHVPSTEALGYGAHWWLGIAGPGSFSANGYAGQYIVVVPEKDLILVRNGDTPAARKDDLRLWMGEVAAAFD